MKIGLRFFARSFSRFPTDSNLSVEFDPVKCQRRVRVGVELLTFFALVIGKKHEPVLVEAFQKSNPHRRPAISPSCGKAHCIDVANTGFDYRSEPISKLFDRIAIEIAPAQTRRGVFVARSGGITWRLHRQKLAHASRLRNAKSQVRQSDGLVPWRARGLRNNRLASERWLTQLFDYFRNDFNGAIDLRLSVEPAKRETQTPSGAIGARVHCPQHM